MERLILWLIFLSFGTGLVFSQEPRSGLLKRTEKLQDLLRADPEKMFEENTKIIWEAQQLGYKEIELTAILNQYKYYRHKVDFDNMIRTSKHLLSKSISYDHDVFQAVARLNLFESYAFINLREQAFQELQKADQILQKTKRNDSLTTDARSSMYNAFANNYSLTGETEKRIRYTRLAMLENEKFKTEAHKQKLRYISYVNLSGIYMDDNQLDSAEYYATLGLSKDLYNLKDVKLLNYSTLSRIEIAKKNYENALYYLKKVENIKGYRNHINDLEFYTSILNVYRQLKDEENINKYRIKRDSLNLLIKESQNKSLHNILDDNQQKSGPRFYIYVIAFNLILILAGVYFFRKRNKMLSRLEKESQEYLVDNQPKTGEEYSKLIEMLKKKDPAFMAYFDEVFPGFMTRLAEINPNLIRSDLEFCALLKLKIPTHEIALYKNITTKSVQNKKYNIRKKLNIPPGVDIYNWFSKI